MVPFYDDAMSMSIVLRSEILFASTVFPVSAAEAAAPPRHGRLRALIGRQKKASRAARGSAGVACDS